MAVVLIRSALLYIIVIIAMRFMGKRQLGQLQPSEFVVALMIADMAAIPIQSTEIPLTYGILPIVALTAFELILSAIALKNNGFSRILSGSLAVIVDKGVVKQDVMRRLRFTIEDMYEEMRQGSVTHLEDIHYMVIETDGKTSFLRKTQSSRHDSKDGYEIAVIKDGAFDTQALEKAGLSKQWALEFLRKKGIDSEKRVFLLAADDCRNVNFILKER